MARYSIGDRFGRLRLVRQEGKRWFLRCDCGAFLTALGSNVQMGRTASCGCLRKLVSSTRATTHGMSKHWLYKRWAEMVFRCTNPACDKYSYYGGRGITVCDRWASSFESFLADVGMPSSRALSLDRINNDGNYEPGNVRWATASEQGRNRRPRRAA